VGQPIGSRYELDEQLGRGAFGSVWRGRVRDTGEAVAVKVLLEELATDPDVVTRFLRERTALVGLRHRSLVAVRDLVVEGDVLALVMQLVEGPDLRVYLRERGTLGPEEAALLVADVAEALAVAHAAKIIHRDVKPANVLLQPEAGGYRPLLTDFGIARLADAPSVTRTSQVVGTPYYLSPEVISGRKATGAVDIYAAGIMLYELLTGHPPFRGRDAMEVFRAHQTATAQRPQGVSDRLWTVALAALGKDPDQRPSANELAARLRAAVRVNHEGTTVRLPVNPNHGTVVLPALPAELKAAAGAHAAPHAVWPPRAVQAAQAQDAVPARQNAQPQTLPQGAAQQGAQVVPINRAVQMAAPTAPIPRPQLAQSPTPIGQSPVPQPSSAQSPAGQPSAPQQLTPQQLTPQQTPQRSAPARPSYSAPAPQRSVGNASGPPPTAQPNQYPMAFQNPPRPVPPGPYGPPQQQRPQQQRPQQQPTYQAPRSQAPRQAHTYAPGMPGTPAQRTGLSCLSKLAILVIVLAVAVAIGVTVGKQLAKRHATSGADGLVPGGAIHRNPAVVALTVHPRSQGALF
jgi:serine/threonine-protein kinase